MDNRTAIVAVLLILCLACVAVITQVAYRNVAGSEAITGELEALREELGVLHQTLGVLPVGVAIVSGDDGVVAQCNESFASITGKRAADIIGHQITQFRPSGDQWLLTADNSRELWEAYRGQPMRRDAMPMIRGDGETIEVEASARAAIIRGKRVWILVIDG